MRQKVVNLVVETTALTVAEKQAELYLKTLAALKYSHTVCVNAEGRILDLSRNQLRSLFTDTAKNIRRTILLWEIRRRLEIMV